MATGQNSGGCAGTAEAECYGLLSPLSLFQLGLVVLILGWAATPRMYTGSPRESTGEGGGKTSMVIEWVEYGLSFGGKDRTRDRRFSHSQAMYVKQKSRGRRTEDQSEEIASI